jgi:hypothetical protein
MATCSVRSGSVVVSHIQVTDRKHADECTLYIGGSLEVVRVLIQEVWWYEYRLGRRADRRLGAQLLPTGRMILGGLLA